MMKMNELKKKWENWKSNDPFKQIESWDKMWQEIEDHYEKEILRLGQEAVEDTTKVLTKQFDEIHRKKIEKIFEDIDKIVGKIVNFDVLGYVELKKKHLGSGE